MTRWRVRPDQLDQGFLRKTQANRDPLRAGNAMSPVEHQQAVGQTLLQRLRRLPFDGGQHDTPALGAEPQQGAAEGRVAGQQHLYIPCLSG